jgi:hypothetical protein
MYFNWFKLTFLFLQMYERANALIDSVWIKIISLFGMIVELICEIAQYIDLRIERQLLSDIFFLLLHFLLLSYYSLIFNQNYLEVIKLTEEL